jgi:SAM-dependent methyltransferase
VANKAPAESSYLGRHADLYDVIYSGKEYSSEAAFVDTLFRRHGAAPRGAMLELACGTGTHAVEFAELGYDVTATDYSEDMLRIAGPKCGRAGRRIELQRLDMRELGSLGRTFPAIACLFDSIGYVRTNEAVAQVLAGVRKALAPGGVFVFEFWHAPAMLREHDPTRVRRMRLGEGELLRISETSLDTARQLAEVRYELVDLRPDGTYTRIVETQVNRYFFLPEMTEYLRVAGLELLAAHAGFSEVTDIDMNTWHIVAAARAR